MIKKILMVVVAVVGVFTLQGCNEVRQPSSDQIMNQKQENLSAEAARAVDVPAIKNFYEKKLLKTILELRDNPKTINYAYLFAEGSGKLVYIGRCYGFGIPYATQFTNPQKIVSRHFTNAMPDYALQMPQADPSGLFSPASAEGTWLDLVNPENGDHAVTYIEARIIVSQFPLNPKY